MGFFEIISGAFKGAKRNTPTVARVDWLDTREGNAWEEAGNYVYEKLDTAMASVKSREIRWSGKNLTVNQIVARLVEGNSYPRLVLQEHVLLWLSEAADVREHEEDTMDDEDIDAMMSEWVNFEKSGRRAK